jgi:hypothetical protein
LAATLIAVAAFPSARAATNNLALEEILRRAMEEAKWVGQQQLWDQFAFNRHTIVKEFDKTGKVVELKEIWYEIDDRSPYPRINRVLINGRPLSGAKLASEQEGQARTRKAMARNDTPAKRDAGEISLTPELISRYHFTLLGLEQVNGREAYLLAFRPRSQTLPVKEMADRLLNQIYGRLWIDCDEFEVARADIRLQAEIKLWAGLLAALRSFTFTADRVRLGDRIWFNARTVGDFEGRKLLDPAHIWLEALSTNYHRINRPPPGAPESNPPPPK